MLERTVYIPLKRENTYLHSGSEILKYKNLKKNHTECKEALPKRVCIIWFCFHEALDKRNYGRKNPQWSPWELGCGTAKVKDMEELFVPSLLGSTNYTAHGFTLKIHTPNFVGSTCIPAYSGRSVHFALRCIKNTRNRWKDKESTERQEAMGKCRWSSLGCGHMGPHHKILSDWLFIWAFS